MEEKKPISYKVISSQIYIIFEFYINTIEREEHEMWKYKDLKFVLLHLLRLTRVYYESIVYLCEDPKQSDYRIKPEYMLAVPPICRVLNEILCTLVYLKDNLDKNLSVYIRSGVRDKKRELDFFLKEHEKNGGWDGAITKGKPEFERWLAMSGMKEEEVDSAPRFPYASTMASKHVSMSAEAKDLIQYVNDWYYSWLSKHGHVSLTSLGEAASFFRKLEDKDNRQAFIDDHRSFLIFINLPIVLAIFTEVHDLLQIGDRKLLLQVWKIAEDWDEEPKRLYKKRYEKILTSN